MNPRRRPRDVAAAGPVACPSCGAFVAGTLLLSPGKFKRGQCPSCAFEAWVVEHDA